MAFYFTCYVLLGLCFGVAGTIHQSRQDYRIYNLSVFWAKPSTLPDSILILAIMVAPALAIITSLIQGGIWALATIAELYLGAFMARMLLPTTLINLIGLVIPVIVVIIFGALWGFWHI